MNADQEYAYLIQANRHIAEAQRCIARQRKIVARMLASGDPLSDVAETTLQAMEESLRTFKRHRQLIVDQLREKRAAPTKKIIARYANRHTGGTFRGIFAPLRQ